MIRTAQHYAEAFVKAHRDDVVSGSTLIANLLRVVDRHNDRRKLPAILGQIEKLLIAERGGSHFAITSARTLGPETRSALEGLLKGSDDVMTFSTDESLIAGMRIAKDHEHELDYSFSRAVSRLFA